MNIEFTPHGFEDFNHLRLHEPAAAKKVFELILAIQKDPFNGIGKPEGLRANFQGYWSRRITDEHRLVYKITGTKGVDQKCIVVQCRFHY